MWNKQVWGAGHTDFRHIPSTLPSQHGRVIVFERWELFMEESYDDGVWDKEYWAPPNMVGLGPPDRKPGDIRWSVGFGHTEGGDNPPYLIGPGYKITRAQAGKLLEDDIRPKERWVNTRITVPLTPFMYTAIVSLAFQFGQGRLDAANKGLTYKGEPLIVNGEPKTFPFIDQFNSNDYVDAFITILGLNFKKNGKSSKGLILRRASEVGYAMTRKD